jgi:hypothetical protein
LRFFHVAVIESGCSGENPGIGDGMPFSSQSEYIIDGYENKELQGKSSEVKLTSRPKQKKARAVCR